MQTLHELLRAETFFARLAEAPRRLLLLDYDGTLAPFQVRRDTATPYPGVAQLLDRILASGETRVAVVSGRAAREIPELLKLRAPVEVWGSHGAERLRPDGTYTLALLPPATLDGFAAAEAWAVSRGLGECFERKPAAVALHWRGLSEPAASSLATQALHAWPHIASEGDLELRDFDGGLELRARDFHKGRVVTTLLAEAGADVAAAYLGDDLTDEDAFQAIAGRGLGVLVRPELRPTHARLWLRPPEELLAFLEQWRQASAGGRAHAV